MRKQAFILLLLSAISACAEQQIVKTNTPMMAAAPRADMPAINLESAIYELPVRDGVSYQELIDSLKSISEGMNLVNPANFPIAENMKKRGIDAQGVKEVRSYCNLAQGTEIMLDHPKFLVFVPCRIAIYEKPDANKKLKLYLALDRPSFDLKSIKNPTARAQKSAQELETSLLELMYKASKGDF